MSQVGNGFDEAWWLIAKGHAHPDFVGKIVKGDEIGNREKSDFPMEPCAPGLAYFSEGLRRVNNDFLEY